LCPPYGVDVEAEVVGDLLKGCSAVELAGDASVEMPPIAGIPNHTSGLTRIGDAGSSCGRQAAGSSPDQSTRS
jgi:hypothetical protein